jgi:hypothetical protein
MRWSKLKQLVEDRMADSLQHRVEVHSTRYHNRWQEDSRGWFTIDKREGANFSSAVAYGQLSEKEKFESALGASLFLPVGEMLCSGNEVLRAFAMLDRRVGKRRLREMELGDDEASLVWQFYDLRCEAEGIRKPAIVATA